MSIRPSAATALALALAACGGSGEPTGNAVVPDAPRTMLTPVEMALRDVPPALRDAHQQELKCDAGKAEKEGRRWAPTVALVRETTKRLQEGRVTPGCGTVVKSESPQSGENASVSASPTPR